MLCNGHECMKATGCDKYHPDGTTPDEWFDPELQNCSEFVQKAFTERISAAVAMIRAEGYDVWVEPNEDMETLMMVAVCHHVDPDDDPDTTVVAIVVDDASVGDASEVLLSELREKCGSGAFPMYVGRPVRGTAQ